jgi:hypothetical protein
MTFVGLLEARDQSQTGRLARAGGTEHGEEFAFFDVQGDGVDGTNRAEMT